MSPRVLAPAGLALCLGLTWAGRSEGQTAVPPTDPAHTPLYAGIGLSDAWWEFSLDSRIGYPEGRLRVGENGGHAPHPRLPEDLGITMSEALEASVGLRLPQRDPGRLTGLYYLLQGKPRFLGPPGPRS